MPIDVRRLRVLREVAAHGSFSAAAESLAFTQPAVSRQIATLEAEAGTRLVDRTARGVRLTPAGELLVEHAEVRPTASLLALHEAGIQQHLEVVRDGRLRQTEWLGEVAHARLAPRLGTDQAEDP